MGCNCWYGGCCNGLVRLANETVRRESDLQYRALRGRQRTVVRLVDISTVILESTDIEHRHNGS